MRTPDPLTPAERSLRARIGAYARASQYDSREMTAAARAAGPGQLAYWLDKVDPEARLSVEERQRRAEAARSAHYAWMAYRSARARRRR